VKKKFLNPLIVLSLLVTLGGVFAEPTHAAPAECYWVGDGGNWSDATNHWATSSGGAPGAGNLPDSSSNVHFDGNSFTVGGQTVTIDATAYCADMDWTGATDNPTLDFSTNLDAHGDVTLIAAMSITGIAYLSFPSGAQSLTTNGTALTSAIKINGSDLTLVDDLVVRAVAVSEGSFIAVDRTITASHDILITGAGAKTLTFGAAITTSLSWQYTGSNLTVTANTATIKITGIGALAGGDADYNGATFELNGTAHTISGSFTCEAITTPPATTQTLTIAAGSNITATTMTLSGDATHAHNIISDTAGTLAQITANTITDDYVNYTDMIVADIGGDVNINCTGAGGGTFAGGGQTYNDITVEGAGDYALTITGSNTFNEFHFDASAANKDIIFTDGTTQTVDDFTRDAGTNIITLDGTGVAGWNIAMAGTPPVSVDYLDISYSTATPADTWYAGRHSTDTVGNSGWTFTGAPYLYINIDGSEEDAVFIGSASVPDNTNDIILMDNSTTDFMPYMGQFQYTVDDTLLINYKPNAIIVGTTLPDREGTAQNGTFTYGSNPAGIAVSMSGLVSDYSVDVSSELGISEILPSAHETPIAPEDAAILVKISKIPILYPVAETVSEVTGFDVIWLFRAFFLLLTLGVFILTYSKLQSIMLSGIFSCVILGMALTMTVFPFYALGFIIIILVGSLVMEART